MRNRLLVSIASAALLAAPVALAQGGTTGGGTMGGGTTGGTTGTTGGTTGATAAMSPDQQILEELHTANQMEIEMGKLGKAHGMSKAVKDFADRMVKDHTSADKQVSDFAKKNKISLRPTTAEKGMEQSEHKEAKDTMARLKKLKGTEFDKEYMTTMVQDHDKVINKITDAQDKVDTATKDLLSKLLPTLQEHRTRATEIRDNLAGKAQR